MHLEADIAYNHVLKENKRNFNFCSYHNTTALSIVIFVKIGYLSTFNIVHNFLRSLFMRSFLLEFTEPISLASRLLGAIFGFFILDRISKKWHYAIPLFTIAAILVAFGCLLTLELVNYIWTPLAFFIPLEFLIGIGVGGMSEILKAEIFPFRERKASMALSYFVEEIVHILSIIIHYGYVFTLGSNPSFWPFIFAPFAVVSGIFVIFTLRDSRKETLKDVSMAHSEKTVVVTPTS
jgi:MFS family permease